MKLIGSVSDDMDRSALVTIAVIRVLPSWIILFVKLTFEMLNVFIVLVKLSQFLRQKISRHEGDSNLQPSDSCRML